MAKFEAVIYNAEVRKKVAEGDRHKHYADDWADMHYIEIEANTEEHARTKVEVKHPRGQGFVLDSIHPLD